MGTRGRTSAAELEIVGAKKVDRPSPPSWLTSEQASEWHHIVNDLPADQITRAKWPLLESYCQHTVMLRHIRQLIDEAEKDEDMDLAHYDKLAKMQERESGILARLSIRLGVAQSTSYERMKRNGKTKPPWQVDNGEKED